MKFKEKNQGTTITRNKIELQKRKQLKTSNLKMKGILRKREE